MKKAKQIGAALEVPRDLLLRRYPPFVTGGRLPRGDVPVFVFHSIEEAAFTEKAEHLTRNGYVSLSAAEYLDVLKGKSTAPPRAVVLTFDDGRRSVLTAGLPIMKRLGLKGILFLVPGRTPDDPVQAEPGAAEPLLSWSQVRLLVASGLFDIESHALNHARVHVSGRIAGFLTPAMQVGYEAMDVPLIVHAGRDCHAADVPLGTPILHAAPRLSELVRFLEDEDARVPAQKLVADEGGASFFQRGGWEGRLRRAMKTDVLPGRFETTEARLAAIHREIVDSKRLIEEKTGRAVRHLCYPWHASGPTAERLAIEAGYETAFGGKVNGVPLTRPGGDLRRIARIGEDYVLLLPGKGRLSLISVLQRKWSRRFGRPA